MKLCLITTKNPTKQEKKMVIVPGNYGELYFSGLNRHLIWERFEPIPHCKMPWPFKPWWSAINRSQVMSNVEARSGPQGFLWCWELRQPYEFCGTESAPPPALQLAWSLKVSGYAENVS